MKLPPTNSVTPASSSQPARIDDYEDARDEMQEVNNGWAVPAATRPAMLVSS